MRPSVGVALARERVETAALIVVAVALGVIVSFAAALAPDVYRGIPRSVPVSSVSANCEGSSGVPPCSATVVRLNPGRFRVAASTVGSSLAVQVGGASDIAHARILLIRANVPGVVTILRAPAPADTIVGRGEVPSAGVRVAIPIPAASDTWDRVRFVPSAASGGEVTAIDELGFFASADGLVRSQRFFLGFVPKITLLLCACLGAAAWFLSASRVKRIAPWMTAIVCLAISTLELGTTFSPTWSRDLRAYYAAEWLTNPTPGSNLIGGLQEGSRIVQGLGETVADRFVQTHRMPGYGLFCAAAAGMGRTTDLVEIAVLVIVLQLVCYSAAAAVCVAASQRLFSPRMAWVLGILLALLPKQLAYTQVDSLIAAIQFLVLAAIIRYLAAEADGEPPFGRFVEVNLAFALWFVMRSDVVPAWFVVAGVLARRRWWRLALPVSLAVLIALPWALYKSSYRHEFALLPTNTGEVLLLGLCEVPGRFPYACVDDGYFAWASHAGHADPMTPAASMHAIGETIRYWATYPVHFAFMVWTKAHRAATVDSFPLFNTRFNFPFVARRAGDTRLFYGLVAVMVAALAANYQRRRTWLLGWALFLNMPIFFVMFASSGRFYAASGVSLVVATLPLLWDREFYRAIAQRPTRVALSIGCILVFAVSAGPVERFVVAHDAVHYWAPLLDPAQSMLR